MPSRADRISRLARLRGALKGVLVTRLAGSGLCVVNTHPVSNRDGDWSSTGRFYPLHRAQLDALARVVLSVAGPAVVCGDFNIDRGSSLFDDFVAGTGLVDAFGGSCPATFRAEYLPAGETPHCIDFILTSEGVKAEAAGPCCSPGRCRWPAARDTSLITSGCTPGCCWRRRDLAAVSREGLQPGRPECGAWIESEASLP